MLVQVPEKFPDNASKLVLNLLAVTLSQRQINGIFFPYKDDKQLDSLRAQTKGAHIIKRIGRQIICVPTSEDVQSPIIGDSNTCLFAEMELTFINYPPNAHRCHPIIRALPRFGSVNPSTA